MLTDKLQKVLLFARQDLIDRYRADWLGTAWLVIQPLLTILLFSAVFSTLMRARLPNLDPQFGYTVYLITGILAWATFSQVLGRLAGWYKDRSGLYRKIPLGLFAPPLSVLLVEWSLFGISMGLFLGFLLAIDHPIFFAWLWLIPLIALLSALAYAVGIVLGMLEVFVSDIRRVVPLVLQLGFWLTPIVYTTDVLPEPLRSIVTGSPVSQLILAMHSVVLYGDPPKADMLLNQFLLAILLMALAILLGRRLRKALRDAL